MMDPPHVNFFSRTHIPGRQLVLPSCVAVPWARYTAITAGTTAAFIRRSRAARNTSLGRHHSSAPTASAAVSASSTLLGSSQWGIWAALACAGAAALQLERTKVGKELSAALIATLLGLSMSNLGVIPSDAPHVYGVVNSYLLPLAVPLLLLGADLRRVVKDTGRLLQAFLCGSVASIVGSFTAFSLMPLQTLGDDGWKVAGALTARHIGGSVNYVAVSEALALGSSARMAGLAADDVIVSIYFIIIYALAKRPRPDAVNGASRVDSPSRRTPKPTTVPTAEEEEEEEEEEEVVLERGTATVRHGSTALAVSAVLCAAGHSIAATLNYKGGAITVITALTVALATAFPKVITPLIPSGECLATILMQIFFASVGASGNIATVVREAPALFMWSAVAISVHLVGVLLFERLFKFTRRDACLASNANIGGPTTAAGMAAAKGWSSSVVPALLIGIFGYATATFVGVFSAHLFRQMQQLTLLSTA